MAGPKEQATQPSALTAEAAVDAASTGARSGDAPVLDALAQAAAGAEPGWAAEAEPGWAASAWTHAVDAVAAAGAMQSADVAALFAGVSGAVAVAATLVAVSQRRRARRAAAAAETLARQQGEDLTAERVFVLKMDRIVPGSDASARYARAVTGQSGDEDHKLSLRAVLDPRSLAETGPAVRALLKTGEPFEFDGCDAAGVPWRLQGETDGARALLRMTPQHPSAPAARPPRRAGADDARRERPDAADRAPAAAPAAAGADRGAAVLADPIWRAAVGHAPSGVAVFEPGGRLLAANRMARKLWRLEDAWIESGPTLRAFLDILREKGRAPEQADPGAWRQAMLSDPAGALGDGLWPLRSGEVLRVSAAAADGAVAFFVSDETESLGLGRRYKSAQGASRAMLAALDLGLCVIDAHQRVALLNAAFADLWRLPEAMAADAGDKGGPTLAELASVCARGPSDTVIWRRIEAALRTDEGGRRRAERFKAARGGAQLLVRITPLPDGGALIACADVTDAHRAEMALRERNEALEAADQLKTDFLNDVAHQLRTPLTAVFGFADMIRNGMAGPLQPQQQAYMDDVLAAAGDLADVIRDSLDLGALKAGAMELLTEPVDMTELVADVVETLRIRSARRGAAFGEALGGEPIWVTGDRNRLKHALLNLGGAFAALSGPGDHIEAALDLTRGEARGAADQVSVAFTMSRAAGRGPVTPAMLNEARGVSLSLARRIALVHGGDLLLRDGAAVVALRRGAERAEEPPAPTSLAGALSGGLDAAPTTDAPTLLRAAAAARGGR